jgi:Rad52/22 family double-strand break repair protein.
MKKEIIQILKRPFGQELIRHRQGHDGKQLDYVPVQHYVDRLHEGFDHDWSFELTRREIIGDQILVEVKLTAAGLIKTGIGGASITRSEDNKTVISLADDIKMAEADALKRACRLLGIGGELYATEQDDDAGIISGPTPSVPTQHRAGPHSLPPSPLPPRERLTSAQLNGIKDRAKKQGLDPTGFRKQIKTTYGIELEYLNRRQASEVITGLDANKPTNGNGTSGNHAWAG